MTEREKLERGMLFHAGGELAEDRKRAKLLLWEFNNTCPDDEGMARRPELLKELLGGCENPYVEPPFFCDYGYNIHLGKFFYANHGCIILDGGKVTIGDDVLFGPNVCVFTAGHPVDPELRRKGWEYSLPISIGNNVWVGGNVSINPGVTIGDNAIIGSGSVVTKDIPANVIAVGNPCRVIKEIEPGMRDKYTGGIPTE